jgi:hypothetical protein
MVSLSKSRMSLSVASVLLSLPVNQHGRPSILDELCREVACLSVVYAETIDAWRVGHGGGRDCGMEICYIVVKMERSNGSF